MLAWREIKEQYSDRGSIIRALFLAAASASFGVERIARVLAPATMIGLFGLAVFFVLTIGAWVMVVSARVASQRAAQQIAGLFLGGMVIGLTAVGSFIEALPAEL